MLIVFSGHLEAATPHFRNGRDDAAHHPWQSRLELNAPHRTFQAFVLRHLPQTGWWRIRDGLGCIQFLLVSATASPSAPDAAEKNPAAGKAVGTPE